MNHLVVACLALGVVAGGATAGTPSTPPAGDVAALATALASDFQKGDLPAVYLRFDETMRRSLPQPKLREMWTALQTQVGELEGCAPPTVTPASGYRIAWASCRFARGRLTMKSVFDAKGRLAGLFFVPADPPKDWAPPDYARPESFRETEVTVGADEWAVPGTLTMPVGPGPFPAVVLVHGSGPHDRDETIGPNRPFKDLAWGLASRGIAVLRYDKRTKTHAARMAALGRLTVKEEVVDDALRAFGLLRATVGVDPKRVSVLGHSFGGTLAPRIAAAEPAIAAIVILAGATRSLPELIVAQSIYLAGPSPPLEAARAIEEMKKEAARVAALTPKSKMTGSFFGVPVRYWIDLKAYRPAETARALRQPILVLQGERDYQVTMTDLAGWRKALSDRPAATIKTYPKLNHFFAAGEGRSTPAEYDTPSHVAGEVVEDVATFLSNPPGPR